MIIRKGGFMKRLYKSKSDKKVCGVCGGLAEHLDIDPTLIRLGVAFVTLFSVGLGIVAYIVAAVIIPEQPE